MKKRMAIVSLLAAVGLLAPVILGAAGSWKVVTGKAFDSALPKDFYLETNAIPTEKRNAALLETSGGAQIILALLDTSGYTSQVQEKYLGMLITETPLSVCGHTIGVGSYGFGLKHPMGESSAPGEFMLYNQAGHRVASCSASKDMKLAHPTPLAVKAAGDGAEVYLGRYLVKLKP
jgi:hypothetical protein